MEEFEKLVDRFSNRIYSFAFYYLGNREMAEDVTQEVLLRLWRKHNTIENGMLQAWVTRVTKNAAIDAQRRKKSYRAVVAGNQCEAGDLENAVDGRANPAREAEQTDFKHKLEEALTTISEPYRSILILREIQDLKYDQIAESLGLPMNTVKVYLHRARKMLREHLSKVVDYDSL